MPPIVEKMCDLNKWLLQRVAKFPRDQRLLLGDRLMQKSLDIQDGLIAVAQTERGEAKTEMLAAISLKIDQLRYLLRLACDSRCMSRSSWCFCVKNLAEIGRMLGGWIKKTES
jgi:hypothetical protein